jgi:hypothetical protein
VNREALLQRATAAAAHQHQLGLLASAGMTGGNNLFHLLKRLEQ